MCRAARRRKGARLRDRTHCIHGHSLSDAYVSIQLGGYIKRDCRTCWGIRSRRASVIKPEIAKKVEVLLLRGVPTSRFTKPGPAYLVQHKVFTRFRLENSYINGLVAKNRIDAIRRGQQLRRLQDKNEGIREQNNDYFRIRAMLPAGFPDKDDVVSDIFEAILEGSLKREDVRVRVQNYITAHNRMFPTKYAKFGDSPLVSLDEVLFEDGSTTRGDTVSRGLWD
jgi:hypothetical protein